MSAFYRIALLAIALLASTVTYARVVELDRPFTSMALVDVLSASLPGSVPATPEEALAAYRRGEFEAVRGNLGRGYRADEVWLAFDLAVRGKVHEVFILEVGPAFLDSVEVWQATANGSLRMLGRGGDQVPHDQVDILGLQPTVAVPVYDSPESVVLIRIRTTSTQAALVTLFSRQGYPTATIAEGMFFGSIFTLTAVVVLFGLGLYILMRETAYLIWFANMAVMGALWFILDGFAYRYLTFLDIRAIGMVAISLGMLSYVLGVLAAIHIFNLHRTLPRLHRFLVVWSWAALLLTAVVVVAGARPGAAVLFVPSLPALLALAGGVVVRMVRGDGVALAFGLPILLYIAASMLNILASLGWAPYSHWSVYGWQVAGGLSCLSLQAAAYLRARDVLRRNRQEREHLNTLLVERNLRLEDEVAARTEDLEQALRGLQKAEAEQRQLLSMASHEFRTPAAMIKASVDSLGYLRGMVPDEVERRLINVRKAAVRLTGLADTLIDQDRLQELALRPRKTEVDLCALVREVADKYPAGGALDIQLPPHPVTLLADGGLLGIALHNLIDNALRHGAHGRATVCLCELADAVELQVADVGPGISDAAKEQVFARFYTVHQDKGKGLGLAIVRSIAEAHDGRAYATDNRPQGAVLVIRLALPAGARGEPARPDPEPAPAI